EEGGRGGAGGDAGAAGSAPRHGRAASGATARRDPRPRQGDPRVLTLRRPRPGSLDGVGDRRGGSGGGLAAEPRRAPAPPRPLPPPPSLPRPAARAAAPARRASSRRVTARSSPSGSPKAP